MENQANLKTSNADFLSVIFGRRYYNPDLGRWVSRDPIGEAGGINVYRFIRNATIVLADILGLEPFYIQVWLGHNYEIVPVLEAELAKEDPAKRSQWNIAISCATGENGEKLRNLLDDSIFLLDTTELMAFQAAIWMHKTELSPWRKRVVESYQDSGEWINERFREAYPQWDVGQVSSANELVNLYIGLAVSRARRIALQMLKDPCCKSKYSDGIVVRVRYPGSDLFIPNEDYWKAYRLRYECQ